LLAARLRLDGKGRRPAARINLAMPMGSPSLAIPVAAFLDAAQSLAIFWRSFLRVARA